MKLRICRAYLCTILLLWVCSFAILNKEWSEIKELIEFDQNLASLRASSTQSLEEHVGFSLLYHMREERWKQGGDWEALEFTNKALNKLSSTERSGVQSRELRHALTVHKIRLLSILGMYEEGESFAAFHVNEHRTEFGVDDRIAVNISLQQERSVLYYALGDTLLSSGDAAGSVEWFLRAIALNPCLHQSYYKAAMALTAAPYNHRQSVSQDSSQSLTKEMQSLIRTLEDVLNRISMASGDGVKLLSADRTPLCTFGDELEYYHVLLEHSHVAGQHAMENMERLARLGDGFRKDQLQVIQATFFWSLYMLTDALQDTNLAFFYLQQARNLERIRVLDPRYSLYSLEQSKQQVKHVLQTFTADYYPRSNEPLSSLEALLHASQQTDLYYGSPSARPVFVVGFFRSGSTLLESLVSAHRLVWGLGEHSAFATQMHLMQEEMLALAKHFEEEDDGVRTDETERRRESLFKTVLRKHARRIEEAMLQRCAQYVYRNATLPKDAGNGASKKRKSSKLDPAGQQVPLHLRACHRIMDKMLLNYRNIGLIHLIFPFAKVLHTVRDPVDTLWSCMVHRFGDASAYTLDVRLLVEEFILYQATMQHFRRALPPAPVQYNVSSVGGKSRVVGWCPMNVSDAATPVLCDQQPVAHQQQQQRTTDKNGAPLTALLDVRYDAVVTHKDRMIDELWRLLGLPSESETAQSSPLATASSPQQTESDLRGPVRTASFLQVQRPISSAAQGKWRRYQRLLRHNLLPLLRDGLTELLPQYFAWSRAKSTSPLNAGPRLEWTEIVPYSEGSSTLEGHRCHHCLNWMGDEHFDYQGSLQALSSSIDQLQQDISIR